MKDKFFKGILYMLCLSVYGIANAAEDIDLVEVIATPLSTDNLSSDRYAGNIQSLSSEDIQSQQAIDLSESLIRNIGSITVNTAQNNPYQNDIFYRGFLASSLVGSAIGLSVYLDGVRINEGFGDTINWDLIPDVAISNINLIPGSNPLFGLNTLGGAITLNTKSGLDFEGTEIGASGGSWGRWDTTFEHGGNKDNYNWYIAANVGEEDGWRDHSPSEIRQVFAKGGWDNETSRLNLSYTYNDNDLIGNGFAPERLLDLDREAVHTFPDNTINELHFFNALAEHQLNSNILLSANGFYRDYQRRTLNGDAEVECEAEIGSSEFEVFTETGGEEDDALPARLCEGNIADVIVANNGIDELFDEDGNMLTSGDLERESEGEYRTTLTDTESYGGALQATVDTVMFDIPNQFVFGFEYNQNTSRFDQTEADANLVRRGNSVEAVQNQAFGNPEVSVSTKQRNLALYVSDTMDLTDSLSLNLSGRWQHVDIEIRDLTGLPENADLNGDHDFSRFNPSAGINYLLNPDTNLFVSYSEGFRVPTAAELTCADPNDPCNLPNAFVADPPLDPVIARTVEFGARFHHPEIGDGLVWDISFYRTQLHDDLLFTATQTGGAGFFQNVGKTQRQGVELGVQGRYYKMSYFAQYSHIDATFETSETLASLVEESGMTSVRAGNSIPGIPDNQLKLGIHYQLIPKLYLGWNLQAATGSYLRADEANELPKTDDYAIVNFNINYEVHPRVTLWGKIDNIFDTDYETVGIRNFNANADNIFGDDIEEERFLAPGAPRAGWLGVNIRF